MTSYTLQVQPRASYTIEYSNQRGPQGPTGAAGPATTDASLLVSGTLSDARLSSNVLLVSGNLAGLANTATARTNLGLAIGTNVQAWDADLDAIAALTTTATGRALLTESVAQTGTGGLVRETSPTLVTPVLGAATGTSVNLTGTVTASGTGTHTFGTTNTVTMAAGALTATGSVRGASLSIGETLPANMALNVFSGTTGRRLQYDTTNATLKVFQAEGTSGELRLGAAYGRKGFYSDTTMAVCAESNISLHVSSAGSSLAVSSGGVQIGSNGTAITNILSATASLDFGSIAANEFADLTITVTGAAVGDTVALGVPHGSTITDVNFSGWVSAANTITVRATNNSSTTARDPASGTFRATVIRF